MNSYREVYEQWQNSEEVSAADKEILKSLSEQEIRDSFYQELEFGTGGLRGVLGPGTNRMNVYTVRRATQGLADYLNASDLPKSVAIGYDSRINSDVFAREAAAVLSANEIKVWIYPRLEPTPALSFAVRDRKCGAGICITASHNPAKYNGYKVYGPDGCQITLEAARAVLGYIEQVKIFGGVKSTAFEKGLEKQQISWMPEEVLDTYVDAVAKEQVSEEPGLARGLKLVYTPLNGSGLECVKRILDRMGVTEVTVVPEQEKPDGHFPTCPYPNPEIAEAMQLGLKLSERVHPDLLLGTDPDCDRCGIAVPGEAGSFVLMSGNEVGVLLLDYICKMRRQNGRMPERPVAVTTIVSTDMAAGVAEKYGVELRRTLTGFKFIGEQIGILEAAGEKERYVFGFEESYGYLSGGHVRDKDAVNAVMLICEMAGYYKRQGKTLFQVMQELYEEFGVYDNQLLSFTFEGAEGMQKMRGLMDGLKKEPPAKLAGFAVRSVVDYNDSKKTGLPAGNVLEYLLENDAKVIIRPSGTEPKIKAYLSAVASTGEKAREINRVLEAAMRELIR